MKIWLLFCLLLCSVIFAEDPYEAFFKAAKKEYKEEIEIKDIVEEKLKAMRAVLKQEDQKAIQTICLLFKDSKERVRELTFRSLETAMKKSKDKELRQWIATDLAKERDPAIRSYVFRLIASLELEDGLKAIRQSSSDPGVQTAALMALKSLGKKEDAPLALKALSNKEEDVRAAAVWALIYLDLDAVLKEEEKILKDSNFKVINTYIRRLEEKSSNDATRVAKKMLTHKQWHVKVQAIDTLSYFPDKEAVTMLIERLKEEKFRVAEDISDTLYRLTDKDIGPNAKGWESWWKANQEKFSLIKRTRKDDYKKKIKELKNAKKESKIVYHGIPITSDHVAFLIDTSDSQKEAFGKATRIEKVKEEMIRILKIFKPEYHFNIISFNTSIYPFSKEPVQASSGNINTAAAWVEKFKAEKRTNVYDAITAALDPEIDTLILLTDGAPTDGVYVSSNEMLEAIFEWNEVHHVIIHTVYIGISDEGAKMLSDISGLTNGLTVTVKEE